MYNGNDTGTGIGYCHCQCRFANRNKRTNNQQAIWHWHRAIDWLEPMAMAGLHSVKKITPLASRSCRMLTQLTNAVAMQL